MQIVSSLSGRCNGLSTKLPWISASFCCQCRLQESKQLVDTWRTSENNETFDSQSTPLFRMIHPMHVKTTHTVTAMLTKGHASSPTQTHLQLEARASLRRPLHHWCQNHKEKTHIKTCNSLLLACQKMICAWIWMDPPTSFSWARWWATIWVSLEQTPVDLQICWKSSWHEE